jgi:nucleotide-binding universal stress UspA family protein
MLNFERILVPIDFSRPSLDALDYAVEFSRPYKAQLTIISVVERGLYGTPLLKDDPRELAVEEKLAAETKMAQLAQELGERGIECETLVRSGVTYEEIIDTAKQIKASLIIMSTHGRTGLAHVFIGSVAERVVREATCPVLTIRNIAVSAKADSTEP